MFLYIQTRNIVHDDVDRAYKIHERITTNTQPNDGVHVKRRDMTSKRMHKTKPTAAD